MTYFLLGCLILALVIANVFGRRTERVIGRRLVRDHFRD
jgi:hypothetical protein